MTARNGGPSALRWHLLSDIQRQRHRIFARSGGPQCPALHCLKNNTGEFENNLQEFENNLQRRSPVYCTGTPLWAGCEKHPRRGTLVARRGRVVPVPA